MPPKPSLHPLAGQGPRHGGPEADKVSQHHYHHTQGPAEMGSTHVNTNFQNEEATNAVLF